MTRKPYIFKRSGFWIMRYRETINDDGTLKTVQRAMRLVEATTPKQAAKKLAEDELKRVNVSRPKDVAKVVTLGDFVKLVYMPFVKANLRAASAQGYLDMWDGHFAPRAKIAGMLMKDVSTSDIYEWLAEVASTDKNKKGEPLKKNTLKHLKSFLSGIFTHALAHQYVAGSVNPVQAATVPQSAPEGADTYAYSLDEIKVMLALIPEPGRTMVATAAFTGLRRSEIRGLQWESYSENVLRVTRSIVEGKVQGCKSRASKAAVPLLPSLARLLDEHRQRDGNPQTGPIFRTAIGTPLDPNNVLNRKILPSLKRCVTCRRPEAEHTARVTHEFERDPSIPTWQGWHAFRRGLGTVLHDLGVDDKTIQAILRHSDVRLTQLFYIKTLPHQSVKAMETLDAVLCSTRALDSEDTADTQLQ